MMPTLDVSDAITCPEFSSGGAGELAYTRAAETVGADGMASTTPAAPVPFYGVVTVADESELQRTPQGDYVESALTIHTLTRLQARAPGTAPDVVTWRGNDYTVTNVANYSQYGQGFVAVRCELIPLDGGAP